MEKGHHVAGEALMDVLGLGQEQRLLVVFDLFGFEVARLFAETAFEADLSCLALYVPLSAQLFFAKRDVPIPEEFGASLDWCDTLVTALSDHEDCTRFRGALLDATAGAGKSVLHMPGVDIELLAESLHSFDAAEVRSDSMKIGSLLDGADRVEIYTRGSSASAARSHCLVLSVRERQWHVDLGVATPGEIVQLPAGEIYAAPREFTAEGWLVINGSAPEVVLRDEDVVMLRFDKGIADVRKSHFADTAACRELKRQLLGYESADPINLALGEFGVGLNKSITRLTGNAIHDEKAAGSAHIALGYNKAFGGAIDCACHVDLIFVPERIVIDGEELRWEWGLEDA